MDLIISPNTDVGKHLTQPFSPKRKSSFLKHDEIEGSGKKRRMEMETKTLCDVMITKLGAAKVVAQSRRAQ